MFINDVPVSSYGAIMLGSPRISPAAVSSDAFSGRERSVFDVLGYEVGLKRIECSLAFQGTVREIQTNRSRIRAALLGKKDLFFAFDGFFYWAVCSGEGELESESKGAAVSRYAFTGIQHDPLISVQAGTIHCLSTYPKTSCRLKATVGSGASSYILGGCTFGSVAAGDVLVFDGIDGKVTKNGVDVAATWTTLPSLTPGSNTINCPDIPTVEYYPTYM